MTIREKIEENTVRLEVSGHVDAVTSGDLQKAILLAFQKMPNVYLDFTNVDYISSAGLRALLIGEKTARSKGGHFTISHITKIVEDVFKVTGFDKLLNIE